jgi:hypothetical protein
VAAAAVIAVAASLQVPEAANDSRVDVRMLANQTRELQVTPTGAVLRARDLRPGQVRARGRITVRNVAPGPLDLRVGAASAGREVDDVLHLAIRDPRRTLFRGPLGRLRRGAGRSLRVASGRGVRLVIQAWIPSGLQSGFVGRAQDLILQFSTSGATRG